MINIISHRTFKKPQKCLEWRLTPEVSCIKAKVICSSIVQTNSAVISRKQQSVFCSLTCDYNNGMCDKSPWLDNRDTYLMPLANHSHDNSLCVVFVLTMSRIVWSVEGHVPRLLGCLVTKSIKNAKVFIWVTH